MWEFPVENMLFCIEILIVEFCYKINVDYIKPINLYLQAFKSIQKIKDRVNSQFLFTFECACVTFIYISTLITEYLS